MGEAAKRRRKVVRSGVPGESYYWHRRRVPLALALLFAFIGAGSGRVSTPLAAQDPKPPFENVTIVVGGYQTFARYSTGEEGAVTVMAELRREGTLLARDRQRSSPAGDLELAFRTTGPRERQPVIIRAGDRLSLWLEPEDTLAESGAAHASPPVSASWTAGFLSAEIDETGAVAGGAPAGRRVTVTAANTEGDFASGSATVDEDGLWRVDLGDRFSVGPGTTGTALYVEDGVVQQRSWAVRGVRVRVGDPVVEVVDRAGASLAIRILRWTSDGAGFDRHAVAHGGAVAWRGGGEITALVARDAHGRPVAAQMGDHVHVSSLPDAGAPLPQPDRAHEGLSKTIIELFDLHVDPQRSVVSGSVLAAATLHVSVDGETQVLDAEPGETWTADFGTIAPIRPDTAALVENRSQGWSVTAYPRAFVAVDGIDAAARGRGVAGDPVVLHVLEGDVEGGTNGAPATGDTSGASAVVSGTVAADGTWRLVALDGTGAPIPLSADTQLRIDLAGNELTVPAAPVSARARASRDLVQGEADPGSAVTVVVGANPASREAGESESLIVGADGTWRVDFSERYDLVPGTPVQIRLWPPGGLPAELDFPVFRANAQSGGDRVRIEGWPGQHAEIRMERGGKPVATASCTVHRTTCDALLQATDGGPAPRPAEGDEILVYPEREAAVTLPVLKFAAHIDLSGADVVGASPPQEPVEIIFRHDEGRATPLGARVGADDNGVFDYELATSQWDLVTPGLIADVYHPRPGGHRLFSTGVMESVRAWPGTPRVSGVVEPGTQVMATLHEASEHPDGQPPTLGEMIAGGAATANGLAVFDLVLRDEASRPVAATPGATLVVTHARRTVRIPIAHLAAWPIGDSGAIAGATTPKQSLRAIHAWRGIEGGRATAAGEGQGLSYEHLSGASDLDGTFAFPAPADRLAVIAGAQRIMLGLELGEGAELRREVMPGLPPGRAWMPNALAGR